MDGDTRRGVWPNIGHDVGPKNTGGRFDSGPGAFAQVVVSCNRLHEASEFTSRRGSMTPNRRLKGAGMIDANNHATIDWTAPSTHMLAGLEAGRHDIQPEIEELQEEIEEVKGLLK